SGAKDLNLDGYPDLLAGARAWDDPNGSKSNCGRVYVYSGKDGSLLMAQNGENANDFFGFCVSSAQDVNQDGHADLLAGSYHWTDPSGPKAGCGRMYVYSGTDGSLLMTKNGEATNDFLGFSVSSAHDVNLDGY